MYLRQLETWSVRNDWVARAAFWDAHVDQVVQERNIEAIASMRERHARVAVAIQNKLVERLQTLDAAELTPAALVRWLEASVKIERLSRGDVSMSLQLDRPLAELSDEELDAAIALLSR